MAGAPLAKGRRDLAQIIKITSSTFLLQLIRLFQLRILMKKGMSQLHFY